MSDTPPLPSPTEGTPAAPPVLHNSTEFDTFFDSPTSTPETTPRTSLAPSLTPRQHTAISLLTSGETISSTASVLGVHRTTLHNWKREPAFAAELARRQHEVNHAADARLRVLMLQSTHHALQSLHAADDHDRWRNAFRLLTILRPYHAMLATPDVPPPPADTPATRDADVSSDLPPL